MFLTTAAMWAMLRVQLDPALGPAACPHKVIVYLPACQRYPVQADCHTTEHVGVGRMSLPFETTLILRSSRMHSHTAANASPLCSASSGAVASKCSNKWASRHQSDAHLLLQRFHPPCSLRLPCRAWQNALCAWLGEHSSACPAATAPPPCHRGNAGHNHSALDSPPHPGKAVTRIAGGAGQRCYSVLDRSVMERVL